MLVVKTVKTMENNIEKTQVYVHCFFSPADEEWPAEGCNVYDYDKEPDPDLVRRYAEYKTYTLEEFKLKYPRTAMEQLWEWDGQPFQI